MGIRKTRRIAPAGLLFQASTEDYSALRFFKAAPRMSPSEAPESDEPN
jgi:hypothetical protein